MTLTVITIIEAMARAEAAGFGSDRQRQISMSKATGESICKLLKCVTPRGENPVRWATFLGLPVVINETIPPGHAWLVETLPQPGDILPLLLNITAHKIINMDAA